MARYLAVKGGTIRNIIEYPATPPEEDDAGNTLVPEPVGTFAVGDAFDTADFLLDRRNDRLDQLVFRELFRLTNAARTLGGQAAITPAQYRAFLKTQ